MKQLRTSVPLAMLAAFCAMAGAGESHPVRDVVYLGATLIDSGTTIDGATPAARPRMAVETRGDRILAVRSADGFQPTPGEEVVDVSGKFIVPGFINTHVHLATLADPPVAKAYLRRELYSGVTAVRDMAGDVRLIAELKREAECSEIVSPDIYFVAVMAGPSFFMDPRTQDAARGRTAGAVPWMQAIGPQTNLPLAIAEARGTGATAIKIYADLPATLVRAITAEAHRQHMPVWAHAAVFPALPSEVVDAGVDVVSHACLLGFEISQPPVALFENPQPADVRKLRQPNPTMDALMANMKRRGTILDATLYTYEESPSRSCPDGINTYLAREAYAAGIPLSAGTDDDAEWKDPASALDTEMELLVTKVGMTPGEALRAATLVGARAAGIEYDVGSVTPGKLANLVVLDEDPLQNISNIRSVDTVIKRGVRYHHAEYKPASDADFVQVH